MRGRAAAGAVVAVVATCTVGGNAPLTQGVNHLRGFWGLQPGTAAGMAEQQITDESPSEVVGRFATPEAARAALVRIEGLGVDADRITLLVDGASVPSKDGLTEADHAATSEVASSAGIAAGLGAIAGAAAGVVGGIVTGDVATGATIGAAAAVGGGVVGGLAGTYAGLPVNEDAWTTYELDPAEDHDLTVTVRVEDRVQAERVREALRGLES